MDPEISGSEHVHPKKNEGTDSTGAVGLLYEQKWKNTRNLYGTSWWKRRIWD